MFQRCLAACDVPVVYSQGFHPHMKMSFAPPLKTGWESHDEYLDVQLERRVPNLPEVCNAYLPEGLRILAARELPGTPPKLAVDIAAAELEVRVAMDDYRSATGDSGESLERLTALVRDRFGDVIGDEGAFAPRVTEVSVSRDGDDIVLRYVSTADAGKVVAPAEIVGSTVGDPASFRVPLRVTRTAQFVERDGRYVSPMLEGVVSNTS